MRWSTWYERWQHVSGHTDLCKWDRWRWGRPPRRQETPRGGRASGTPVGSACLSGTAERHRLGEVQTHLRRRRTQKQKNEQTYKKKLNLIHVPPPPGSRFTWIRSAAVSLSESSTKQFGKAPFAVHADVKGKYCGTTYFECMRQIVWISSSLSLALLSFQLTPLVTRCSFAPTLSQSQFLLNISLRVWWIRYKTFKRVRFLLLSSPPILWQNIRKSPHSTPPTGGLTHF